MKIIYKNLMRILCSIGCVYHSLNLSRLYFSYETTTNVKYQTQSHTYLPAITIGYKKKYQLKDEYVAKYGNNLDSAKSSLDNLTIQQQFHALDDPEDRVLKCKINAKKNAKNFTDCQEIANYSQFINYEFYGFTIFPQINREPNKNYQIKDPSAETPFLCLFSFRKITQEYYDFVGIHLHSRDNKFQHASSEGRITFNMNEPNVLLLKYNEIILKYNFKPFGGCFEEQTKDYCISKCIINDVIEKTGEYPAEFFSRKQDSTLNLRHGYKRILNELEQKCKVLCEGKTECYKQYFVANPLFSITGSGDFRNKSFHVVVEYSAHPSTIYEISLKMSFEEYLCLLSSIFSLWFGFSVLMFADLCPLLFAKFSLYLQKINFNNCFNYKKYIKRNQKTVINIVRPQITISRG